LLGICCRPPGDTARIGMSDDGEPHGTAGKPILTVLLHSEIGEIVAVVTRYFGGTKLGTGGLVRAYSGSVKNALAGLSIKEKRNVITLTAIFDYSKILAVRQMIESFNKDLRALFSEVKRVIRSGGSFSLTIASHETSADYIKEPTAWGVPIFKHAPRYIIELLGTNGMELLKEQRLLIKGNVVD